MKRAVCLLLLLAACGKKPAPPAPMPEPEGEPPVLELPKRPIRLQRHDRIHLRASILPADAQGPGYAADLGVHKITILEFDDTDVHLDWQMKERFEVGRDQKGRLYDEDLLFGKIRMKPWASAQTMVLPIHWSGEAEFSGYALLWLTPAAWQELKGSGKTIWRIDRDEEPGTLELRGRRRILLRVNDETRQVDVLLAESAAATFLILDQEDNPLVLSVKLRQPREAMSVTGRTRLTFDYEVLEIWTNE
jgi:hypothetical protein